MESPSVHIKLPEELLAQVDAHKDGVRIRTRTAAIIDLLLRGLATVK